MSVASEALALQSAISQIQNAVNGIIANVDNATGNRLHEVSVRLADLSTKLQTIITSGEKAANYTIDKGTGELGDVIAELHKDVSERETAAFVGLNGTLADVSNVVSSLPFTNVAPFVGAIVPLRMLAAASVTPVHVYGWFPGVSNGQRPIVKIGNNPLTVQDVDSGKIGFTIPQSYMQQDTFVPVTITIPPSTLFDRARVAIFGNTSVFEERVWIRSTTPHRFTIVVDVLNPQSEVIVAAQKPYEDDANSQGNSGKQNENSVVTAAEMFHATNASQLQLYDADSARFVSMGIPVVKTFGGGNAGCSLSEESSTSVRILCSAPPVSAHMVVSCPFHCYWHSANGTHAVIDIGPTYRVSRLGVPSAVADPPTTKALDVDSAFNEMLPETWQTVLITDSYRDGDDKWTQEIALSRSDVSASKPRWSAQIVGNNELAVQTHE